MRILHNAVMVIAFACPVVAHAQALNINFAGVLGPNPSDSYGAAAGQTGFWNPVAGDDPLMSLDGSPTPARLLTSGSVTIDEIPGASPDDAALMEPVFGMPKSGYFVSIYNLEPGFYDLYLYMWGGHFQGEDRNSFRVENGEDVIQGSVGFTSAWPGGHINGVTYRNVRVEVLTRRRSINVFYESSESDNLYVNGLQLVPVPAPSALFVAPLAGLIACRRRRR